MFHLGRPIFRGKLAVSFRERKGLLGSCGSCQAKLSLLRCLLRVQLTNSPLNLVTTRSSLMLFDVSTWKERIWKGEYYMYTVYIYAYYTYVIAFFQDVVQLVCSSDVSVFLFGTKWFTLISFDFKTSVNQCVCPLLRLVVRRSIVNLSKW